MSAVFNILISKSEITTLQLKYQYNSIKLKNFPLLWNEIEEENAELIKDMKKYNKFINMNINFIKQNSGSIKCVDILNTIKQII